MSLTKLNRSAATLTKNRTEGSIVSISGMCVTCVDGCIGMCEIGKSAYRGTEVLYPQPFGIITSACEKEYPVDLSHFTILGTVVGAHGIEADSDKAIFPAVNIETKIGRDKGIKVKMPIIIPGLGSTRVAKVNWEGLAIGAALAGIPLTIGENVCGMDEGSEIKNGKIVHSPDMERRVKLYKEWQRDGYGTIVVQANVEDTRLGVHEYVIQKLGVEAVELKWGQGAKDIGGEVKIKDLKKAQVLKERGYIVLPDPTDPTVIEAFEKGAFKEFERHSRLGMVDEESFIKRVEELRKAGAKYVFLKTGAYRPADLARAVKYASKAKIDLLTVDGAGGGTGMSPWRMMNEWGVPGVELWSLLYQYVKKLADKGEYIPDIAIAGGFTFEDQIFKGLALGAPYFKLIGMARGPLAAAMVGKTIGKRIEEGQIPVYVERFGNTIDEIFITAPELRKELGKDFEKVPPGALGLYTYLKRLNQGLKQLMAGNRKFSLEYITRNDIAALTKEASEISGIPYIMEIDKEEVEKILNS
ncbi:FMN-binding glutamate synthase family protein [Candidatus Aminicenantes bacterium AC-335-K20]|jgi:glutamate synthase domain-containing protein 2|nr:FMN-binding glutamate synthase family protein [SCandidatus Aminicenantes bacterium Aminicenantia_JdfR_composite]MCP2618912.1 FMN-binding glutamate synthase family protein [Candidatus Aminicenantes bacterium AC-335-A11]MCP2619577.1 FMN-binding glutamate synthase family protein [Candidatus Aminicenantes bacterium AC-335-K20]MCP2621106.1 FMN-binding glutamate synthase family protein [Candidatus Aminicenantes bacterium AC-334-E05]